jgi:hypothetical protein
VLPHVEARCLGRVGATSSVLAGLPPEIEPRPTAALELTTEPVPIELYELFERR